MKHHYFALVFFSFISSFGLAQQDVLCGSTEFILIEDQSNIPAITDNGDKTITLTHKEQYITDIFSNYIIYDFYQSYPDSGGTLSKFYTIYCQSKDLINNMKQNIPSEIFSSYSSYASTAINKELIQFVDGKIFNYSKYESTSDKVSKTKKDIPNNFNLQVEFNYNLEEDLLYMQSVEQTPCGNTFSVAFKGGETEGNNLQLWESYNKFCIRSSLDQACYSPEISLYDMIGIFRGGLGLIFDNITPSFDDKNNTLQFLKQNAVFGEDIVVFEEDILSVNETTFDNIKLISSNNSSYIEFTNIKKQDFQVEVFSVLGEKIIKKTPYQKNTISLNTFQSGLYIIKLTNSNNDFKIFKYFK